MDTVVIKTTAKTTLRFLNPLKKGLVYLSGHGAANIYLETIRKGIISRENCVRFTCDRWDVGVRISAYVVLL